MFKDFSKMKMQEENLRFIKQSVLDANIFCQNLAASGAPRDLLLEARENLRNFSKFIQNLKASVEEVEKYNPEAVSVIAWKAEYPEIAFTFALAWQCIQHDPIVV